MPKSGIEMSGHMEWSDEWPCPSERAVDRVTPIIAPYCSRGGPSKVEKEAAAIVWEVAGFEIFNWTFSHLMNVWSADFDRMIEVEADGVVRGFFNDAASLCSADRFVDGCALGSFNVLTFAKSVGFYDGRILKADRRSIFSTWNSYVWPRLIRTGVAGSDGLGLLKHEPGQLVW
jgi:hypothetical protein